MRRAQHHIIIRGMQSRTRMRYHLPSVRKAIISKSTNNKYWSGCGEENLPNCWWQSWCGHRGDQYEGSSENKTRPIIWSNYWASVQFSSVAQSCPTLCDPMNCSTPGLPVHHQLPELTQTRVHQVGDAIQPSHPLLSPSPAFSLSQHQSLFQWVNSSHEVAKVLEF